MKLFRHTVPLALLALPAAGHALGLGRVGGEAVLGESLQLEVPLTGTVDRPLEVECITLRPPPDSIDAEYFPRDLVARIDRQSGVPRLLLSTRSALRQPLVEFRVSVSCGYNLSHDYLLMVSPRADRVQPSVLTTAPAAAPAQQALASAPSAAGLPDGLPAKIFVLDKDMTLEQLARRHFPGPLRQGRFMRWVVEANPQLFTGAGKPRQHRLNSGQQLLIPVGVPPRRPGDYQNGLTPLGEPMPAAQADIAGVTPVPKAAIPGAQTQPTQSADDGRKDRLIVSSGSGSRRDLKETMALVERLTGVMEQQVSAQTANNEKIQQLELKLAELGSVVARMEEESLRREAALQSELQAVKKAHEAETERSWWQLLFAVVAGGVLGAGLMQGYRVLSARKQDTATDLDDFPNEELAPDAAANHKAGPLTEFGWEDEPRRASSSAPLPAGRPAMAGSTTVAASPPPVPAATPVATSPAAHPARPERARNLEFEPPLPTGKDSRAALAPIPHDQKPDNPAAAAIELANIMASMGLAESAAQTMVEHIRENPRQSLGQWLKLLELHRLIGNKTEFEHSANEMRQHFNVQADEWTQGAGASTRASLEAFPHIRSQLVRLWREPQCVPLLQALLMDNREGTRVGFPLSVAEEILLLIAILSSSQ